MKQKIILYKKIGETPLKAIENFKKENTQYSDIPMTYAGRLDPMAEGILVVLTGDECKKKEEYLNLDKEYEVGVLFGFSTDTFDILGKVTDKNFNRKISKEIASGALEFFIGKFEQEYPAYSSKTVGGVQLHELADKGELPDELPSKEVEIYNIEIIGEKTIESNILLNEITNRIQKVDGDFRQKEILEIWKENLENCKEEFFILKIKVCCSSGTYMRSLTNNLGRKLEIPALAYSIKRTKIGVFLISDL